jgi:hypothetical protein
VFAQTKASTAATSRTMPPEDSSLKKVCRKDSWFLFIYLVVEILFEAFVEKSKGS